MVAIDPYPWLHATQYSYYFGHVFLLANCLSISGAPATGSVTERSPAE